METRAEAERYCAVVERAAGADRREHAADLELALTELLAAAGRLPEVEPSAVALGDGPTLEQWRERFAAVQHALGDWDSHWTTLSPSGEAVMLPLADDLGGLMTWRVLPNASTDGRGITSMQWLATLGQPLVEFSACR